MDRLVAPGIVRQLDADNYRAPVHLHRGVGDVILFAHAYGQTAAAAKMAAEVIVTSINRLSGVKHDQNPTD